MMRTILRKKHTMLRAFLKSLVPLNGALIVSWRWQLSTGCWFVRFETADCAGVGEEENGHAENVNSAQ